MTALTFVESSNWNLELSQRNAVAINGVRELSSDEIDEVNGAWIVNAVGFVVGGVAGAAGAYTAGGGVEAILTAGGLGALGGAINPFGSIARSAGAAFATAHVGTNLSQMSDLGWTGGFFDGS